MNLAEIAAILEDRAVDETIGINCYKFGESIEEAMKDELEKNSQDARRHGVIGQTALEAYQKGDAGAMLFALLGIRIEDVEGFRHG